MKDYKDYKQAINEIKEDITLGIKLSEEDFKDTYNDLLELVEKEKPNKALYIKRNEDDLSPVTTSQCRITGKSIYTEFVYCPHCGQKLDWS